MRFFEPLLITIALFIVGFVYTDFVQVSNTSIPVFANNLNVPATEKEQVRLYTVLFTGDIMLARDVEHKMHANGFQYPYQFLGSLFASSTYQVGNFESAIPMKHIPTQTMSFEFSVPINAIPQLKREGFTHVSLANNHSADFGVGDLEHTREVLQKNSIQTIGDPYAVSTSTVSFIIENDTTIALIALNLTENTFTEEQLKTVFSLAKDKSDLQIVYVHWGTEYNLVHSKRQEQYAKLFIDLGADIVIGHHPHVVQDIALYNDVPVFYSLGNFIFDQYFSDDVQIGLALQLSIGKSNTISLIPITTIDSHAAPQIMEQDETVQFFSALAGRSDKNLTPAIKQGVISF